MGAPFIGGSDHKKEGRWVWTDGSPVNFHRTCYRPYIRDKKGYEDYLIMEINQRCQDVDERDRKFICEIKEGKDSFENLVFLNIYEYL